MNGNGSKYAAVPGKIPGTLLNLGGVEFIAAPFNLDGVQAALDKLGELSERLSGSSRPQDAIRGAAEVLLISLRRNNPDLTLDELLPLVDMVNWEPALLAVCKASGIEFAKPGEPRPASP